MQTERDIERVTGTGRERDRDRQREGEIMREILRDTE